MEARVASQVRAGQDSQVSSRAELLVKVWSGVSWCKLQLFLSIQIKTKYTDLNIFVSDTKKKVPTIKNQKKCFFSPPYYGNALKNMSIVMVILKISLNIANKSGGIVL